MVPTLEELAQAEAEAAEQATEAPDHSADGDRPGSSTSGPKSGVGKSGVGKSNIEGGDAGKSGVAGSSKIGMGSQKGSSPAAGVFVFLCPNGHKLNGPPSLKGKAGQCPHCGARFVIPEDDVPEDEIPTGEVEDEEVPAGEPVEDEQAAEDEEVVEAVVEEVEPDPEPIPPGVHALGYIVGRLWDHRSESTELEIFLQEGEIMSPDHYAEILSTGDYGVFAHKDGDDMYSLSVIPWSAIRRVDLRRVSKLSNGTFR
ncbi:hypothetical protein NA78x_003063 [Anatilimnocola sp. NA78]|uniref:hypothetical protein n=1 Tax=Anatilimnocola sp. NA78 TaxID=3415683 RepID=UPI003CE5636F